MMLEEKNQVFNENSDGSDYVADGSDYQPGSDRDSDESSDESQYAE